MKYFHTRPVGLFIACAAAMWAGPVDVVVVAGQSNALNWHAAASDLPPDRRDDTIFFYHETGGPPSRGGILNATSGGQWSTLGPQRQEPFVKFERDFFGPEITLARRLAGTVPRLAVIKIAYFGTNLAVDWDHSATTGNMLYRRLHGHVRHALAQLRERGEAPHLAGFFWIQGETDGSHAAHASAYGENLSALIAGIRTDFHHQDLPFVLARVGPPPARGYQHQEAVRIHQVRIARATSHTAWVDTDDLPRDADGVHLRSTGVMILGERMADAWLALSRGAKDNDG